MARVFISHSRHDNFEAIAFRDWLISEGWSGDDIFLDLFGIGAGERWKTALALANERCEAVIFLATLESIQSTECRVEIRMAEDRAKEVLVAIAGRLTVDSAELDPYREGQIVDLTTSPREEAFKVGHDGDQKVVEFNRRALSQIKVRLDQLGISPNTFTWQPSNLDDASPYPGLNSFEIDEAALFVGRSGEIARGLAEIRKLRRMGGGGILVIQAASGAGKSSFLKAGLWPRLARDPDFSSIGVLRPANGILSGDQGLARQLAAYFAIHNNHTTAAEIKSALEEPDETAEARLIELINEATLIGNELQRSTSPDAAIPTPVLAVDQAEELFSAEHASESTRFLKLVARLFDDSRKSLSKCPKLIAQPILIWTIRADSMDILLRATGEAGLSPPALFGLPPTPRTAYREIIEFPLAVANRAGMNITIDPLLVDELVINSDGADALPLLAYTLRQILSDNRVGRQAKLTRDQYDAASKIGGILSRQLTLAQHRANASDEDLRKLFLPRLATWERDSTPPGAKRLIATESELLANDLGLSSRLVDALVEERLLTRSNDMSGVRTVEVAHEILLRQPPLAEWLENDREFLVWRDSIDRARKAYLNQERSLLVDRELAIAREWLSSRLKSDISDDTRDFIETSVEEANKLAIARSRGIKLALVVAALCVLFGGIYSYTELHEYWKTITIQLSDAAARDIAQITARYDDSKKLSSGTRGMKVTFTPKTSLPPSNQDPPDGTAQSILSAALRRERFDKRDFRIFALDDKKDVIILLQRPGVPKQPESQLRFELPPERIFAPNNHAFTIVFIIWTASSLLILLTILVYFWRVPSSN